MNHLKLTSGARADLRDGFVFYEGQDEGVGSYFISEIRADLARLRLIGGGHKLVFEDYHRMVCRTFPYAVYYTFDDDVAVVRAIVDCRRSPDWIREHLDD